MNSTAATGNALNFLATVLFSALENLLENFQLYSLKDKKLQDGQ